ncbi:MAG: arginine repressor [Ruminococcaceae bacterium]|nr:arginine repressor [Oscillospiraceae bacterium]
MKQKRHHKILKILAESDIKTQEQLTDKLKSSGFMVTQATVSRDIKELGLIKLPLADGSYKYAVTKEEKNDSRDHLTIFSKSIIAIQAAMHTIVIKTHSGMANAVAASLDTFIGHEVVGTIAGDDTLLIITENPQRAEDMAERLRHTFSWKE